jgi:hypothetical protein
VFHSACPNESVFVLNIFLFSPFLNYLKGIYFVIFIQKQDSEQLNTNVNVHGNPKRICFATSRYCLLSFFAGKCRRQKKPVKHKPVPVEYGGILEELRNLLSCYFMFKIGTKR